MLKTETPEVSLVTMLEATDEPAVGKFVADVLGDSGWRIEALRKRSSRLFPPDGYWAMYEVSVRKDEEERSLRLVARGAFDGAAWDQLCATLARYEGEPCDPINGIGFPRSFHDSQHAFWFYPFDPAMPGLPSASDPATMTRLLLGLGDLASPTSRTRPQLEIERVRYTPEIGAILRYTLHTAAGPVTIYGKVQPGDRGLRALRIVEGLWQASAKKPPGLLRLPRPLGWVDEYGLLLEEEIPGVPVGSDRMSIEFKNAGVAAAEALAVVHESGMETEIEIWLEKELERLERVAEQFAYVHPDGHFLLRDLTTHMRNRARLSIDEEWLPTHGDLKYDQFVHHDGTFTLLDFDYFGVAETSYDLGKFCGYIVPSAPASWEDSVAAEETRARFLRRYLELRPHATIDRFPIYEALSLALRAMTFMWTQGSNWQRNAETFLVMGHERLYSRPLDTI
jgi:Phosphotransferase enzyme family